MKITFLWSNDTLKSVVGNRFSLHRTENGSEFVGIHFWTPVILNLRKKNQKHVLFLYCSPQIFSISALSKSSVRLCQILIEIFRNISQVSQFVTTSDSSFLCISVTGIVSENLKRQFSSFPEKLNTQFHSFCYPPWVESPLCLLFIVCVHTFKYEYLMKFCSQKAFIFDQHQWPFCSAICWQDKICRHEWEKGRTFIAHWKQINFIRFTIICSETIAFIMYVPKCKYLRFFIAN